MKKPKIGIIVTSTNERTEKVCIESFNDISNKHIHLVKNFFPALEAFKEVCKIGLDNKYDYIFNVDADVIILDNWIEIIENEINKNKDFFLRTFTVTDKYFGNIDKGNKLYNCKYFNELLKKIQTNYKLILKKPKPMGYTNKFINFSKEHVSLEKPIGLHGYEQYYKDIYYRFYLLKIRYKKFMLSDIDLESIEDFYEKIIIKTALKNSKKDKILNLVKNFFINNYSFSNAANKSNYLGKFNISEKGPLKNNRISILKKYGF